MCVQTAGENTRLKNKEGTAICNDFNIVWQVIVIKEHMNEKQQKSYGLFIRKV